MNTSGGNFPTLSTKTVLVAGDGPERPAIRKVLGLCFADCRLTKPCELEQASLASLPDPEQAILFLVGATESRLQVRVLLQVIYHLRFEVEWLGPILVLADESQVNTLNRFELFALQDKSKYVCQLCLPRPFRLAAVLSAVARLRHYEKGAWRLTRRAVDDGSQQRAIRLMDHIQAAGSGCLAFEKCRELTILLLDSKFVLSDLLTHEMKHDIERLAQKFGEPIHSRESENALLEKEVEILRTAVKQAAQI